MSAAGDRWKISSGGGSEPAWTRGGHELVFRQGVRGTSANEPMMAVEIGGGQEPSAGIPRVLFTSVLGRCTPLRCWDVTADGSRFVVVQNTRVQSPPGDVHVMVNWFPELRRLFNRPESR
jgi:hypothetical protein